MVEQRRAGFRKDIGSSLKTVAISMDFAGKTIQLLDWLKDCWKHRDVCAKSSQPLISHIPFAVRAFSAHLISDVITLGFSTLHIDATIAVRAISTDETRWCELFLLLKK